MGHGTDRVSALVPPDERKREVERLRGGLADILEELDHRRRALVDWRLQLRAHARAVGIAAAAATLVGGCAVALAMRRSRRRRRVLAALAAGAAGLLARKLTERVVTRPRYPTLRRVEEAANRRPSAPASG